MLLVKSVLFKVYTQTLIQTRKEDMPKVINTEQRKNIECVYFKTSYLTVPNSAEKQNIT